MLRTEEHDALHEDNTRKETVDDDVPHALQHREHIAAVLENKRHTPPVSVFETKTNMSWYL